MSGSDKSRKKKKDLSDKWVNQTSGICTGVQVGQICVQVLKAVMGQNLILVEVTNKVISINHFNNLSKRNDGRKKRINYNNYE